VSRFSSRCASTTLNGLRQKFADVVAVGFGAVNGVAGGAVNLEGPGAARWILGLMAMRAVLQIAEPGVMISGDAEEFVDAGQDLVAQFLDPLPGTGVGDALGDAGAGRAQDQGLVFGVQHGNILAQALNDVGHVRPQAGGEAGKMHVLAWNSRWHIQHVRRLRRRSRVSLQEAVQAASPLCWNALRARVACSAAASGSLAVALRLCCQAASAVCRKKRDWAVSVSLSALRYL